MTEHSIGIVIPTLGDRPEFLAQCMASVREAGPAVVAIVASSEARAKLSAAGLTPELWIDDPGGGAARAINAGVARLPSCVLTVGWIGDDDLLEPNCLAEAQAGLSDSVVAVFGSCRYIDMMGSELFVNRSGRFAPYLMRVGPNLLPQPGSLISRSAWSDVGGLDESLRWTFDLDLFIRLSKFGKLRYANRVLASFRWHPGSLTAGARRGSVDEASQVRLRHMPRPLRFVAQTWEPIVRRIILIAGDRVTKRVVRSSRAVGG